MRIVFYTDQVAKQEQHNDPLHEAEHDRLTRAVAQPRPNRLQQVAAALHKAVVGPTHDLPGLKPVEWQARS
jgi:hypothetical protein